MTDLEKVGQAIKQLDSKLRLDAILSAIRQIPEAKIRRELELRYWDAFWPADREAAEVYVELGGELDGEDPELARAALQGIEAELQKLVPGYQPQIQ